MPKGGPPYPDCVHCRFMSRQHDGTYRCRQHNLILHTPVRLLCKSITPAVITSDDYKAWFEQVDKSQLDPNMMYIWPQPIGDSPPAAILPHENAPMPAVLASFPTYARWSADVFWQEVRSSTQSDEADETPEDNR